MELGKNNAICGKDITKARHTIKGTKKMATPRNTVYIGTSLTTPVMTNTFMPIGGVIKRIDVIREGVEPDIHNLAGIPWHGYAPVAGALTAARDAEVPQTRRNEGKHFVSPGFWLDTHPPRFDEFVELFLIRRKQNHPLFLFVYVPT